MDTATALWAAAIGAGVALATVALFGALVGRRFRKRARSRGFGGPPPWAFAAAHGHGHAPGHGSGHPYKRMMAGGRCAGGWSGRCEGRRHGADEQPETSDVAPAEQAQA